jgi:hypothetical protein
MNAQAILALVAQGLALLPTLIQTGIDVTQRIENLADLSKSASEGTQTQDQIDAVRNQLDADLTEFNSDLPPEA